MRTASLEAKAASSSPLAFGRIAKPLRGGGGAAASAASAGAASANPALSNTSSNPLTRLQNEEAG